MSSVTPLVANPAKLQKRIFFSQAPRWLHQDMKINSRTVEKDLSQFRVVDLAKQAYTNTEIKPSNQSISLFCNEFISRLGLDSFKKFVQFHEFHQPNFTYLKHYQHYLKTCYKLFNYDDFLLNLLVMCDFRKINKDSIARTIFDFGQDPDTNAESLTAYILKMVPEPRPIFDEYDNLLDNNKAEELIIEDESDSLPKAEGQSRSFVLDTILTLNQLPSASETKSNWIYFNIECGTDELLTEASLMKALKSINVHSVKNLALFNVSRPSRKIQFVNTRISTDEIKKSLADEIDLHRLSILARTNRLANKKKSEEIDKELSGDFSTNSSELEKNIKKLEQLVVFSSKANVRNKGYGFIELEDYETKKMVLKESYRLFGLEIEKSFLVIDDADKKKTIQLNNVPWNIPSAYICNWLNATCRNKGVSFRFGFDSSLESFLSDASYFYVKCNSFLEAFEILKTFHLEQFSDRTLYANFRRGCGRYVDGCFYENFVTPYQEEQQRNHIERRTRKKEEHIKKVSESSRKYIENLSSSHK